MVIMLMNLKRKDLGLSIIVINRKLNTEIWIILRTSTSPYSPPYSNNFISIFINLSLIANLTSSNFAPPSVSHPHTSKHQNWSLWSALPLPTYSSIKSMDYNWPLFLLNSFAAQKIIGTLSIFLIEFKSPSRKTFTPLMMFSKSSKLTVSNQNPTTLPSSFHASATSLQMSNSWGAISVSPSTIQTAKINLTYAIGVIFLIVHSFIDQF